MSIKNKHREENESIVLGNIEMGHLVEDAEIWWDKIGSEQLRKRNFSTDDKTQQDALNATNPVHLNYIGGRSGVLLGYPWDMLSSPERYRVIRAYTLTLDGATPVQIGG